MVLKSFGVKVPRVYTRITPEIEEKAKSLRDAGQSFRAIAIQLGIGISTARRICTGIQELEEPCQEQLCFSDSEELASHDAAVVTCVKDQILESLYIMRDALNGLIDAIQNM